MTAKPPAKGNEPKLWRLRAKAADGLVVTLGRYETAEQAHADCEKFRQQGGYRDLAVQAIERAPDPTPTGNSPP